MNRINHGFYRVAAAIPQVKVADCWFNVKQMKGLIIEATEKNVEIVCFPELSVTAYTCADLFLQKTLLQEAEKALEWLIKETVNAPITFIVGIPVELRSKLYNCAVICREGRILGIVPKVHLPNYSEFYEKRWFEVYNPEIPVIKIHYGGNTTAFGTNLLFTFDDVKFAIEICEDLWSVIPPSSVHAINGANVLFNLSASDELVGKQQYIKSLISQQSACCHAAYIYTSAGFGESSTDLVFSGNAYIYENGRLLSESQRFQFSEQLIISEIDLEIGRASCRERVSVRV
jgi:NAD+ synthase (glutamine-hydrolysing)